MDDDPVSAREAIDRLYPPLAPALLAWANLRLPAAVRHLVLPEDLAQEVWLRAIELFDSFDGTRGTFRGWLFAVAKNVLLEVQRRAIRCRGEQGAGGSSSRLAVLHEVPEEVTSLTRRVARDEQVLRFVQQISRLDDKDRMTVIHCGLEELSLTEAAQRLGEAYDTTAKRWQRLRQRMRSWGDLLELDDER